MRGAVFDDNSDFFKVQAITYEKLMKLHFDMDMNILNFAIDMEKTEIITFIRDNTTDT